MMAICTVIYESVKCHESVLLYVRVVQYDMLISGTRSIPAWLKKQTAGSRFGPGDDPRFTGATRIDPSPAHEWRAWPN